MKTSLALSVVLDPEVSIKLSVLWQAKLSVPGGKGNESFLFRSTEDFERAARTAEVLLQSSPGCRVSGAYITGLDRVARLWN